MPQDLERRTLFGLVAAITVARGAGAAELPAPTERVMLTISGRISVRNGKDSARFDRPMLEALGMQGFTTATPWFREPTRFDGVLLSALLRTVGASGQNVTALALNDYATEIPMSDTEQYGMLLALKRNGEYMPVRDKGPLFIVYPFDSDVRLRSQRYYSRSAWQLSQLIIS